MSILRNAVISGMALGLAFVTDACAPSASSKPPLPATTTSVSGVCSNPMSVVRTFSDGSRLERGFRSTSSEGCSDDNDNGGDTISSDGDFSGFVDPDSTDSSDPLGGFGAMDTTSTSGLPPGSTQTSPTTWTDPNGNTWSCDGSGCLMIIGKTSVNVTPAPVILVYIPGPNGPAGGGSQQVLVKPAPDEQCPQASGTGLPIGANLPVNQDKYEVINIYYVYEPSSFTTNPGTNSGLQVGGSTIVGLIYVTNGGQYFFQSNGADGNFLTNLATSTGLGNALNATQNGVTPPLTSQQVSKIFGQYPVHGNGKGSGKCFSAPLPQSEWT